MKILGTDTHVCSESGDRKINPNLVLELLIKMMGIIALLVSVWAGKTAGTAQDKAEKVEAKAVVAEVKASNAVIRAEETRSFLNADRGSNYVQKVIESENKTNHESEVER